MRAVIIVNARSGRGKAAKLADEIVANLQAHAHETVLMPLNGSQRLRQTLEAADAGVVVGGDGTLHAVLDDCIASHTPVYHAPAGTENLFARQFSMAARADRIRVAVERRQIARIDVGRADGRAFVIMASIGFDAGVIHALHASRGRSISHLSYAGPLIRQFLAFPRAIQTVEADGRTIVQSSPGLLVIANCRHYAMRLDPARQALPDDGQLDVVFFPARSRLALLGWLLKASAGTHMADARLVSARASRIEVHTEGPGACLQLDGEAVCPAGETAHHRFTIEPGVLQVLLDPSFSRVRTADGFSPPRSTAREDVARTA